jgi:LPS export ABC transporter protein LptC
VRALWIAAALLLAACGQTTAPAAPTAFETSADQVTIGMKLKMTEEGTTKANLFADTAVTPPGSSRTKLTGVTLVFSTPSGKDGKLTSKSGDYDPGTNIMVARGNVVLVVPGEQGKGTRTIKSEELHWDQNGDRVWSTRATSLEEGGRTLYTESFTSDSRFTNVQGTNARTNAVQVGEGGIRF